MHILVKTLTGRTETINISSTSSIENIRNEIEVAFGIPSDEQKLILEGKSLNFGTVELKEESCIYLTVDIDGGKKKKKKKTKKPKRHHKKKKVNLAVVNYYKVEGGKVVRLRQRSPVGTFMAEHSDRYYCGKSHITYKKKEETAPTQGGKAEAKKAEAAPAKGGKKK
jgi:small subunit ribosomal protein S27Ae